jgi:hypothetical protein
VVALDEVAFEPPKRPPPVLGVAVFPKRLGPFGVVEDAPPNKAGCAGALEAGLLPL